MVAAVGRVPELPDAGDRRRRLHGRLRRAAGQKVGPPLHRGAGGSLARLQQSPGALRSREMPLGWRCALLRTALPGVHLRRGGPAPRQRLHRLLLAGGDCQPAPRGHRARRAGARRRRLRHRAAGVVIAGARLRGGGHGAREARRGEDGPSGLDGAVGGAAAALAGDVIVGDLRLRRRNLRCGTRPLGHGRLAGLAEERGSRRGAASGGPRLGLRPSRRSRRPRRSWLVPRLLPPRSGAASAGADATADGSTCRRQPDRPRLPGLRPCTTVREAGRACLRAAEGRVGLDLRPTGVSPRPRLARRMGTGVAAA
mmetsp:Transcript_87057/g.251437  ORF Transcript_87057/g.251437 Transcript_87057/m.251437 type:complete len:312 (-) Transcript_87057:282-1217(-)